MSCSSCKHLKENEKYDGAVCESIYYCSKIKSYVNGANNNCNEYEVSYSRKSYTCDEIFEEGEKFCDNNTPTSFYVVLLVIFIILIIICQIFF